jgi:hypothetical protein
MGFVAGLMGFVAGLMGFVAGRDFLKKVPSPHPSPKTLERGREDYCIEIVTTYAFFTLIQPQQTKYALDHEGWVVGVAALWEYYPKC